MSESKELRIQNDYLRAELKTFRQERDTARSRVRALEEELASVRDTEPPGDVTGTEERNAELEEQLAALRRELSEAKDRAELERLRAVEAARKEARAREQLLESVIEDLRQRLKNSQESENDDASPEDPSEPTTLVGTDTPGDPTDRSGKDADSSSVSDAGKSTYPWIAQALPVLGKFSGEETADDEEVDSWIEQLEMLADACGWDEKVKLVHLTTRLKGPALSFYRSCSEDQRHSFSLLKEGLQTRFTPVAVHVRSVQSGLFHGRVQKQAETVDMYAQELKKLFLKAYPKLAKDGGEEGQMILASRFIAGLKPQLQAKLTGEEGSFDQLLSRARFEEARRRELQLDRRESNVPPRDPVAKTVQRGHVEDKTTKHTDSLRPKIQCHNCGGRGHIARNCPLKGRAEPKEARSGEGKTGVSMLEAELCEAIDCKSTTLRTTAVRDSKGSRIGPPVRTVVTVEGTDVDALVDSGSPVTIVSLALLLQVLASNKAPGQTPEEWTVEVKERLRRPTVTVKTYDGAKLLIHAETTLEISLGEKKHIAPVLVQKDAPEDLLLGTDFLPQLGILRMTPKKPDIRVELQSEQPKRDAADKTHPRVSLISATRIPARHEKLVRGRVPKDADLARALFEPAEGFDRQDATELQPALVQPDQDGTITLVARNNGYAPIELPSGCELGSLQLAELVPEGPSSEKRDLPLVCRIEATEPDRFAQLCRALRLDETGLTLSQRDRLASVLKTYSDVFALNDEELGTTSVVEHSIDTGDAEPVRQYARRVPYAMRDKLTELVEDMTRRGVIKPTRSPWASPVVLVSKKDGGVRFCVDYRKLNNVTKLDVYPLPRIDDHLDALTGSKYFSTLDLSAGFWQVRMAPNSAEKTAFVTHNGSYEFVVMPFGLTNAPATFQRLMETVLVDMIPRRCVDYIDDILVIGRTFEDHLDNLEAVLERLRAAGLRLKPTKCHLVKKQVICSFRRWCLHRS